MRSWTIRIITAVTVLLLFWDLIAYLFGENATISVVMTDWGYYSPWMPFAFGVLMGHWWVPAKGSKDK